MTGFTVIMFTSSIETNGEFLYGRRLSHGTIVKKENCQVWKACLTKIIKISHRFNYNNNLHN